MKYKYRRNITRTRQTVRTITMLNEGAWRWSLGIQAGMATGIPMAIFFLSGHPSFGSMATLGALITLYGSNRLPAERLRVLAMVGIGLVITSGLSILCSGYEWLSFICLIVVVTLASIVTAGTGIGPPGPIMFVLVAAISSRFAVQARETSLPFAVYMIPVLIGVGAFLAWLIVALSSTLPFIRKGFTKTATDELRLRIQVKKEDWVIIIRVVAGVIAATLLSKPLGIHRVYWVIVAVTAILQSGFDKKLSTIRAVQRVLGTALGVVAFGGLYLLQPSGLWIIIMIMLLQFATQVVIARNYVLGLIFITPMALLMATIGQTAATYITAKERLIDTLIGAGLAILVFWLEEWIRWIWRKSTAKKMVE